jgi:hypothetical protein
MVKEIWKYLHKPRYVDPGQLDGEGETAARVAALEGHPEIAELLQGLGVDAGVGLPEEVEGSSDDDGNDSDGGEGGGAVLISRVSYKVVLSVRRSFH